MEIIKFDRVVSVSNQIQGHAAQNIIDGEISPQKNWMCEKGTEKAILILQLERAAVLTSIHIGNAHSAFVEVLVGRAADASDHYESLIPMSTFMNPNESKTGNNPNRTRFFNKEDFNESAASQSWDRIKVVCSQPFNKHVTYGLCFLKVHGEKEVKKHEGPSSAKADDEGEIQVGSFFKKKRLSDGAKALTVSEQMKEAEKDSSLEKHTPLSLANLTPKLSEKLKADKNQKKDEVLKEKEDRKTPEPKKRKLNITPRAEEKKNKVESEKKKLEKEKKKNKVKPFNKLMEDVVLVISGYQNPLRADIRSMALKMGSRYSGDWEGHCTHLVCAYENTPKFNQVKGKGKIVRKEWVEKCYKDKKRYPWRRFALDKSDLKMPESEDEIEAEEISGLEEEGRDEPEATTSRSGSNEEEKCEVATSSKTSRKAKKKEDEGGGSESESSKTSKTPEKKKKGEDKEESSESVSLKTAKSSERKKKDKSGSVEASSSKLEKKKTEDKKKSSFYDDEDSNDLKEQKENDDDNDKSIGVTKTSSPGSNEYDIPTDEDEDEDVEKIDTTDYPMPFLPNLFSEKTFYVDPNLKNKCTLERYITAYNGITVNSFDENTEFYITTKGGVLVELFRQKAKNLNVVKPSWILEINEKQQWVSTTSHQVT